MKDHVNTEGAAELQLLYEREEERKLEIIPLKKLKKEKKKEKKEKKGKKKLKKRKKDEFHNAESENEFDLHSSKKSLNNKQLKKEKNIVGDGDDDDNHHHHDHHQPNAELERKDEFVKDEKKDKMEMKDEKNEDQDKKDQIEDKYDNHQNAAEENNEDVILITKIDYKEIKVKISNFSNSIFGNRDYIIIRIIKNIYS